MNPTVTSSRRNVGLIMNTAVQVVAEDAPLPSALEEMTKAGVGAIPVEDARGRCSGLLVRRDGERRAGIDPRATVRDASRAGLAVRIDDPPERAFDVLEREQVGRIPVVDAGRIAGTISRPEIEEFRQIEQEAGGDLSYELSPNDEMFGGNGLIYLRSGLSALRCVRRSLEIAGVASPGTILDFACGHGRVLRFLRAGFPDAEIMASDLDPDAVSYCGEAFGVDTFVSSEDPRGLRVDQRFDVIWSGSLLTHLDSRHWRLFARFFESLLGPSGVLVFTIHGVYASEQIRKHEDPALLRAYDETGFGYADHPGTPGYGTSLSTIAWVEDLFESETDLELVDHAETAWNRHQDVVTYKRR